MRKIFRRRVVFPIVGALAFVVSLIAFFVNSPNAYADELWYTDTTVSLPVYINKSYSLTQNEIYEAPPRSQSGTWSVSRLGVNADRPYLWSGITKGENVTFTRNGSLRHIISVYPRIQKFYESGTDENYYPVKGTIYVGNQVIATDTSSGVEDKSSSYFLFNNYPTTNENPAKGLDGVVSIKFESGGGDKFSFLVNLIYVTYRTFKPITVTLNDNSGSGGQGTVSCTFDENMPASVTVPTRNGYRFDGYYDSNNKQYFKNDGKAAISKFDINAASATLTAHWTLIPPEVQNAINKINAIGTVTYPGSKELITTARTAYDAVNNSYKSMVTNYATLTADESTYNTLKTNAVNNVKNLIGTIGTASYPGSKAAIEAAEAAYATLDSDEKNTTAITNYATLTGARTEYNSLRDAAVQAVIAAIDDIGTVTYPGSKAAIMNAEDLYDALGEDEKNTTTITNYTTLTGDRTEYNSLRDAAVQAVIDKIDDIEIPLVYPGSNTQISSARSAYDALDSDEKNTTVITNYQDLLDVEAVYQVVVEENEIGTPYDTQEFRDKVQAVRNNYNDLTNTQKSLFPDLEYNSLVNYEAGIPVMDLINAIGNVVITPASKALIDAANEAYEALTDAQKELVANYGKLVQANTDYDKALEVVNKIDAIGEGEYSKEKQALITDARDSYNRLTPYQQSIVYNYQKLLDAEIEATEALIDNIGSIKYTSESKALIDKARASYDALEADQKALVENYATLTKDEADYSAVDKVVKDINNIGNITYDQASDNKIKACRKLDNELTNDQKAILPQESENKLVNYEKAYSALEKINSIGSIKYSEETEELINDAREAYNGLSSDQKAILPQETETKLVSYEKAYSALEKINSIGSVEYSEETEELIKDAREAYDGLSPDQKKLINNDDYSVLSTKEEELDSKTSTAIAWGVILVILASLTLCAGLLSIWFLLFKKDNDDDENNKKPQTTKAASSILPLVILASHFGTGPYRAFYIILIIAALAWIAVLVIYILKKKGIIMAKNTKKEEAIVEEANDKEEKEEIIEEENEIIEIRTDNK